MRTTARGIITGTYLSVRRAGRRRDIGWAINVPEVYEGRGLMVRYRSGQTGNEHIVPIADVRIEREFEKRRKIAADTFQIPSTPTRRPRRKRTRRSLI